MTEKSKKFRTEKHFSDGTKSVPEIHKINEINFGWKMGRREFLATSALGITALKLLKPENLYAGETKTLNGCEEWVRANSRGVNKFNLSPDNRILLMDQYKIWKLPEGILYGKLQAPYGQTSYTETGATGEIIAGIVEIVYTNNPSAELCFWNASNGKLLKKYSTKGFFNTREIEVSVNMEKTLLAAVCKDRIAVFSLTDASLVVEIPLPEGDQYRKIIRFSPGGGILLLKWNDSKSLYLYSIPSGRPIRTIRNEKGIQDEILFSPDGKYLVFMTNTYINDTMNYIISATDTESGKVSTLSTGLRESIKIIEFADKGRKLLVLDNGGFLLACDFPLLKNKKIIFGKEKKCWNFILSGDTSTAAFSLGFGTDKGAVEIKETSKFNTLHTFKRFHHLGTDGKLDASGKYFMAYSFETYLTIYSIPDGKTITELRLSQSKKIEDNIPSAFIITGDNRMIITSSNSGQVRLWNLGDGTPLTCLLDPEVLDKTRSVYQFEVTGPDGIKHIKVLPQGSSIPSNSTCICNMVQGKAEPSSGGGSGGGGCSCNRVCTCVPVK